MNLSLTLRVTAAGIVVVLLGALGGWYVFVRNSVGETSQADAARGFGTAAPFGPAAGGTLDNLSALQVQGAVEGGAPGTRAPTLWRVTQTPVAGFGFMGTSSRLLFVERATGNVLAAAPYDSSITRLSNTLFPRVYEASVADSGVVLRSLSERGAVTTFLGSIDVAASSTPQTLGGRYLSEGIGVLAVRGAPQELFYLLRDAEGVEGKVVRWDGGTEKTVFRSSIRGWQPFFLADGSLYVAQNASDGITGYAYRVSGEDLATVAGPLPGLTILPRANSSALLYGSASGGDVRLYAKAGATSAPVSLPTRTVPEKCAWAPGQALIAYCAVPVSLSTDVFLREWYAGALHTTDVLWRIDASAGTAQRLFTPDSSLSLDVRSPVVDSAGAYLAFKNAADDALWVLTLQQ